MAGRARGRTIDPDKITDVSSWAEAYKFKYTNIVHGDRGELFVLDPVLVGTDRARALENPVKTIQHMRGVDYIEILRNPDVSTELRATAYARLEANRIEKDTRRGDSVASYMENERALLEAVDAWNAASNEAERIEAATAVGRLLQDVARTDESMREAAYPYRYIKSLSDITRKDVDYTTNDDRKVRHALEILIPETTAVADRVVATAE